MTRFLTAAVVATVAFAAPASARERTFVREGVTYTYTATVKGDATVLEGKTSKGGDFRFVVKNGWVDGYADNNRVSFRAPKAKPGEAPVQVAAR